MHNAGRPGLPVCKRNIVQQQRLPRTGRASDSEEPSFRIRFHDALSYRCLLVIQKILFFEETVRRVDWRDKVEAGIKELFYPALTVILSYYADDFLEGAVFEPVVIPHHPHGFVVMDQRKAVDLFIQMSKIIPILIQLLFHSPKLDRLAFQLNVDDCVLADSEQIEFFTDLRNRKGVEPTVVGMGSRAA